MTIEVDTPTLRAVAEQLGAVSGVLAATAEAVGGLPDPAAPEARAGLDALGVAWGAALEVLAEDATFMAGEVGAAAERYDTADLGSVPDTRDNRARQADPDW